MSPEPAHFQAFAGIMGHESPMIMRGSHNVCSVTYLSQTQILYPSASSVVAIASPLFPDSISAEIVRLCGGPEHVGHRPTTLVPCKRQFD